MIISVRNVLIVLLGLILSSYSPDYIRFQKIDMTNGLSYNSVLCVMQDHNQYLWVGTRDGLNKMNSIDNVIYKHDINDSSSLGNSQINCLFESKDYTIWVGAVNGINKYNRESNTFTRYLSTKDSTGLSNQYVRCINEDAEGYIWIGTAFGLNRYNPSTNLFKYYYLENFSIPSNDIISLFYDNQNRLWIGTKDGLFLKQDEKFLRINIDADIEENFEVRDIKQGQHGEMWIATEKYGVYYFIYTNEVVSEIKHICKQNSSILSNAVRKLLVDNNTIWCATLDGLAQINGDHITNITWSIDQPNGISKSSIHDIIKDSFGGYWLATYTGGLNYYHPQNNLFPHIKSILGNKSSLISDKVSCFAEDKSGNIWLGTDANGISYWDTKSNMFYNLIRDLSIDISNNSIKSISIDKNGNLWIGTYNGLNFYNPKTKKLVKYFHDAENKNSLNQNQVHEVHVDKYGFVWIGMNGGEFQVFDDAKKQFSDVPGVGKIVNTIFEDTKDRLWVGDRLGLKCVNIKTRALIDISRLTDQVKGQLNYINWISEDSIGNIFIGTSGSGLIIFSDNKVHWFNLSNGLCDNTVNAIVEDEEGSFWTSTNEGISKLTFSKDFKSVNSINYTTANGLQGKQFESGCALKASNGKIVFGGINGINIFNPERITQLTYYPRVVLSDIIIRHNAQGEDDMEPLNYKHINGKNSVTLNYNERNLDVRFAGINFINPTSTFYRYNLNSLGDKWINIEHQRTINFTYLPVGSHELRIQASNNMNSWGNDYTLLTINILPPWWYTWWAYVIYGLVILILLYIFFRFSIKWVSLKNSLQMEQFKHEKELEFHESKLRFFTDVSHELRTPLTLILAPLERIIVQKGMDEELASSLLLIQRNGERMMQLINQVLNLRKFETGNVKLQVAEGNIVSFLNEINLNFKELAQLSDVNYEYYVDEELNTAWFDKEKLEIIIYNLLSNAFKNTEKGNRIKFSVGKSITAPKGLFSIISKNTEYIKIDISNEGKSLSEDDINNIFERFYSNKGDKYSGKKGAGVGLELTKRMVQLHKGTIMVESLPNDSMGVNTFTVIIPINKSVYNNSEISNDFVDSEVPSLYTKVLRDQEINSSIEMSTSVVELPNIEDENKQSLLIVEDNNEVRSFIHQLFEENYIIIEAENGLVGWEKAIENGPDLIISDVMMPEMDGIQLCSKLKSDARTSHIPVILLTARATSSFINKGYETGADEYVTKPFSAEFLILRVKNLIQQRETMHQYFTRQSILEPKEITVTSVDEKLLKKAVDYITDNMENSTIGVETLSQYLGLSRVHFYRKIKALTNLTAVDFIRSIRLKRAASLLKTNKLTIKEVQNMVGFENADYFRKCFKEQFDMTPTEYAEKYKDNSIS